MSREQALAAVCDTFVPGGDGLPSATVQGVPARLRALKWRTGASRAWWRGSGGARSRCAPLVALAGGAIHSPAVLLRSGIAAGPRDGQPSPAVGLLVHARLTLTNPATILAFVAVFASLGPNGRGSPLQAIVLVAGVLLGSATWWLVLAGLASLLRARVTPAVVQGIRVAFALAILTFGVVAVAASLVAG
jgi:hypothetical protein